MSLDPALSRPHTRDWILCWPETRTKVLSLQDINGNTLDINGNAALFPQADEEAEVSCLRTKCRAWWHRPVITATEEAEARGWQLQDQSE